MVLEQLTYISTAAVDLNAAQLTSILDIARSRNLQSGVTGLLVFNGLNFLQTLEGREGEVRAVFASINRDDRHSGVRVIAQHAVEERAFERWSMAFKLITFEGEVARGVFAHGDAGVVIPKDLLTLYRSFIQLRAAD